MLPTFLVIGAMKSGTTALYRMLQAHPEVFMSPVKEPNFFAFAGEPPDFDAPIDESADGINHASITDRSAYEALFQEARPDQPRGEASHTSLYWPRAAPNIEALIPEARLVVILRNPIDRAFSEWLHFVRDDWEPLRDFEDALDAEPQRIADHWAMGRYVDRGRYDEQLERYRERFDSDQLLVLLHRDLVDDPSRVARDLYAHVGASAIAPPSPDRRVNKSGVPSSRVLHRVLTGLQPVRDALGPWIPEQAVAWVNRVKNRNLEQPVMSNCARDRLRETFRPHIERLEPMIGRDLHDWLDE